MPIVNNAEHFFQTDDSIASIERKSAKASNTHGNPIKLQSKLLAAQTDPAKDMTVYVAEAAGDVRRVQMEVCKHASLFFNSNDANTTTCSCI